MNSIKTIINSILIATCLSFLACAQNNPTKIIENKDSLSNLKTNKKMKVEIWSDVMCPFCYIGKRKFETALTQFKDKENIEIVWKSFQLNANLKTDPSKNTIQHLAETKGWSMEKTKETISYVLGMAKEEGLNYNFDKAVVANSFDAHRLIQYAKTQGKGDAAEEQLFKAYFIDGKNTADHSVLIELGKSIGLVEAALKKMLAAKDFAKEVLQDINEAEQIGVAGVPFFVFDRKFAVSGAQDSKVFLDTLNKAYAAFEN